MLIREAKYLGAFLHDIGKFTYRAFDEKIDHETLGVNFFRAYLSTSELFKADSNLIGRIIEYIQRSVNTIKDADYIGASEREETAQSSKYTRRPLISIFQRVSLDADELESSETDVYYKQNVTYYYNPNPIEIENILSSISFKKESILNWKLTKEEEILFINYHNKSYKLFLHDLQILKTIDSFRPFFTTLYKIFEKYTSRVSSAGYASVPDISLFDHSRVVAALTICLEEGDYDNECLLIKGDISGIQNFIFYQIEEAEKASKQLRGRSFYIRILTETLANFITREFQLFDANILMCSGGHFLILAPNNYQNRNKLLDIERKINRVLLKNFGGNLQLILAYLEVSKNKIFDEFYETYKNLEFQLASEKRKKSFLLLEDLMAEPKDPEDTNKYENLFIEIGTKLVQSDFLIEIVFPSQDTSGYIGNLETQVIDFSEFGCCFFFARQAELDSLPYLFEQHSFDYVIVHNIKNTDFSVFQKSIDKLSKLGNIGYSYKFVGSFIPTKNFKPLSFEEIAKNGASKSKTAGEGNHDGAEENPDDKYLLLGVARMDVDNLGEIFANGLKAAKYEKDDNKLFSISRLATLSRELDLFFNGYINTLAEKHSIYLVYSGGDDLFAVGYWEDILEFALQIRKEFQKLTCNNKYFTISCGTVFVKTHYPTHRFAKKSDYELRKAKNYVEEQSTNYTPEKDKISVFERVVKWNELERLLNIGKALTRVLSAKDSNGNTLTRSFVYKLLTLTQECFDENGNLIPEKVFNIMPKLHYFFARKEKDFSKKIQDQNLILLDDAKRKKIETTPDFKGDDITATEFLRILARYFIASDENERKKWYQNFVIPASYCLLKSRKSKK